MSSNLEVSLDDVIKSTRTTRPALRKSIGSKSARSVQSNNRQSNGSRGGVRSSSLSQKENRTYQSLPGRRQPLNIQSRSFINNVSSPNVGTKLMVRNLHFIVTEKDLHELFSHVGKLRKSPTIYFNAQGQSLGTAEVEFISPEHAKNAILTYNGSTLDGRKLSITPFAAVAPAQSSMMPRVQQQQSFSPVSNNGRPRSLGANGVSKRSQQSGRSARSSQQAPTAQRRDPRPLRSFKDLDAELDNYTKAR